MITRIRACLFVLAAISGGAGVTSLGCSNSNSSGPSNTDAATNDSGTAGETSTSEEAGEEASTMEAAAACVPGSTNVATFDSGSATWECFQTMCASSLGPCAADCVCNNTIFTALTCTATAANPATAGITCFGTAFTALANDDAGGPVQTCITNNSTTCMAAGADSGTSDGAASDGSTSTSDGATGDGSTGDGGTTDAGTTDAPTGG